MSFENELFIFTWFLFGSSSLFSFFPLARRTNSVYCPVYKKQLNVEI